MLQVSPDSIPMDVSLSCSPWLAGVSLSPYLPGESCAPPPLLAEQIVLVDEEKEEVEKLFGNALDSLNIHCHG